MPEHLRALVVILALATGAFVAARRPATAPGLIAPADFDRRRNLWIALTLCAFLAHNFWVYMLVGGAILLATVGREKNRLALFFLLVFALPPIRADIPGFGLMNYLFAIDYVRLLALAILLPTAIDLAKRRDTPRFGRLLTDKLLGAYILLNVALQLSGDTLTNTLRHGVFYSFIDVLLPYYVASRGPMKIEAFRDALMSFVVAAMILSLIGMFEAVRYWLLYSALGDALGVRWGLGIYIERSAGSLRAQATTGQPIPLGYAIAVAMGFVLMLRPWLPPRAWLLGLGVLAAGLVAALSRGPWIGAAAMILVFLACGPQPVKSFGKLALAGLIVMPLLLASPVGDKVIDHLPFIGEVDAQNVTYRQRLLEISIERILENPLGSADFLRAQEMQELIQGQGIIDIVNSYLGVGLATGLPGLFLYCGFFASAAVATLRAMAACPGRDDEWFQLGRGLVAVLVGILVILFTVSSISIIPVVYWAVVGLCIAYARAVEASRASPPVHARMAGAG